MNHYKARELRGKNGEDTGLWHYTNHNGGAVYPVGYCAEGCPGHAERLDAYEHQKQYLIDHAVYNRRWNGSGFSQPCEICGEYTPNFAAVGSEPHPLCPLHMNRASLESLVIVGDSFGSE